MNLAQSPSYTNALISEKSPYLLQHAHNPVQWFPWSEESLAMAEKMNRPIFLSIGYSTCHWCHVMEEESFNDPEVAKLLNENFICIKVDREERPDIDLIYMTFIQATTGSGGWPLNVWLTPQRFPIYGGTYFPPQDREGRLSLTHIAQRVIELWNENPEEVCQRAESMRARLQASLNDETPYPQVSLEKASQRLWEQISEIYDHHLGGFGQAPKFPRPATLHALTRLSQAWKDSNPSRSRYALEMVDATLRAMARGGIHDQLGGGFHRYSVDDHWHVPHFEKMLYDQAQIVNACLETFQLTRKSIFPQIIHKTLGYVLHDLAHSEGGFYSAEDADSVSPLMEASDQSAKKNEGAFYTWSVQEIDSLLPEKDATLFKLAYGMKSHGNARPTSDPMGEFQGLNILFRAWTPKKLAETKNLPVDEVASSLESSKTILLKAREKRPRPHRDEKILTAWNGLMLSALARSGRILNHTPYVDRALRCAHFIRRELWDDSQTKLRRSWMNGPSQIDAFPADYAFLIQGLIDLYEATWDEAWLEWAVQLQQVQDLHWLDSETGVYLSSKSTNVEHIFTIREDYDGAEPSPNAISAQNLLRLSALLQNTAFEEQARRLLYHYGKHLESSPLSSPALFAALLHLHSGLPQLRFMSGPQSESWKAAMSSSFQPYLSILKIPENPESSWLTSQLPELKNAQSPEHEVLTLCQDRQCFPPFTDLESLLTHLKS